MSVRLVRRARARLVAGAGAAVLATTLSLTAAPAGAQTTPVELERSHLNRSLAALVDAVDRVTAPAPSTEPPAAEASMPPYAGCVGAGPADGDVPTLVAEIFRCRLDEAGVPTEQARVIVAEAILVSRCESLWEPAAVVFDGRYTESAHPATGYRYTAAGVFQFIRATADRWIDGGYANVTDARHNIDAAARLYLHNRASGLHGWEDWACAAAHDGFLAHSVLPGWPGGPVAMPDWAWNY